LNTKDSEPAFDVSFSSFHPGGCLMSRCDGSVGFISESINMKTWRALGSRNGGEVVKPAD
jgi:hypothetical protein